MSDFLTADQLELRRFTRRIAEEKVRPRAAECDRTREFPWDLVKVFAQAGFYGCYIDEEYGGVGRRSPRPGADHRRAHACGGISLAVAATTLGTFLIIISGTEEPKKKTLPRLARGEILAGFGLTEPAAGSDASNTQTIAREDRDHYVLKGLKHFITNADVAKVYTVITSTDPRREELKGC